MQIRNRALLAPVLMFAVAGPVMADAALDDISRLNAEIAVLTLKAKKAELQSQIEKTAPPTVQGLPSLPSMPPQLPLSPTAAFAPIPALSGIEGLDGDVTAVLRHPNGSLERVKQGTTASDGWHTVQIGNGQVVQQKKNEQRTLFLGAGSSVRASQAPEPLVSPGPAGMPK